MCGSVRNAGSHVEIVCRINLCVELQVDPVPVVIVNLVEERSVLAFIQRQRQRPAAVRVFDNTDLVITRIALRRVAFRRRFLRQIGYRSLSASDMVIAAPRKDPDCICIRAVRFSGARIHQQLLICLFICIIRRYHIAVFVRKQQTRRERVRDHDLRNAVGTVARHIGQHVIGEHLIKGGQFRVHRLVDVFLDRRAGVGHAVGK